MTSLILRDKAKHFVLRVELDETPNVLTIKGARSDDQPLRDFLRFGRLNIGKVGDYWLYVER